METKGVPCYIVELEVSQYCTNPTLFMFDSAGPIVCHTESGGGQLCRHGLHRGELQEPGGGWRQLLHQGTTILVLLSYSAARLI